ncbi:MAG: AraC family transcriptional regulator [Eubacteriales bacterium]
MDYTHIPDISCFYSDTKSEHLTKPDAHFGHQMMLVTEGAAQMVIHHKTYDVKAKSLIFISRMERHYLIFNQSPYVRMVASMSSNLVMSYIKEPELVSVFMQRPKAFCHVVQLSDETYDLVYPLFVAMCDEYTFKPQFYVSKSVSIAVEILINLYRNNPESFPARGNSNVSEAVLNAQRAVNDRFQTNLTLQEIADENFISRHTMSIAFKEIVGITFKEYLLLFRISEAKKLLITTDASIYDIAEKVGYINVNNFIKIFKEREQQTPLKYRKQFIASL